MSFDVGPRGGSTVVSVVLSVLSVPSAFVIFVILVICLVLPAPPIDADGKVFPPAKYTGSLEERAQEAIIIFHSGDKTGGASQDLILKISVEGEDRLKSFGWVVPFPNEPRVVKEDPRLFRELFDYVSARQRRRPKARAAEGEKKENVSEDASGGVEVLSRKVVGAYDVAVVRETKAGALNRWLEREGFQTLEDGIDNDIVEFYRQKKYVFACMKVTDVELQKGKQAELHPLRFSFITGGRDGIYFPMRMTGLQSRPFDVNLYVFYGAWVNDHKSRFGYEHRGFTLKYRDWDSDDCKPNAGKSWSAPRRDPFLKSLAHKVPTVTRLFQKLYPGRRYYLTNIQGRRLRPADVREWRDDLWLFPYYTNPDMVPYDARTGGPAAAAYAAD